MVLGSPSFSSLCIESWGRQEWNRFRGINGDGTFPEINLPLEWGKEEHTWEISLPGTGHASPVIWGNRIFTTCASASDATQYILSIDCKSGKIVWQKEFLSAPYSHHKFNSYASSTPAVERLFFVSWTKKQTISSTWMRWQINLEKGFWCFSDSTRQWVSLSFTKI